MTTVILYAREGCCLCDDAREILERARRERPFTLEERDIDSDDTLQRAYLERIPVVTIDGVEAFELFVKTYEAKYPKATECLRKDKEVLLTFYDFPAEQWLHIRTTNPIESVFSTVRLRHAKTKGSGNRTACLTMVFKLMESASKGWRSLNGSPLLAEVVRGTRFTDGNREKPAA